jgi:hypothetical protein
MNIPFKTLKKFEKKTSRIFISNNPKSLFIFKKKMFYCSKCLKEFYKRSYFKGNTKRNVMVITKKQFSKCLKMFENV